MTRCSHAIAASCAIKAGSNAHAHARTSIYTHTHACAHTPRKMCVCVRASRVRACVLWRSTHGPEGFVGLGGLVPDRLLERVDRAWPWAVNGVSGVCGVSGVRRGKWGETGEWLPLYRGGAFGRATRPNMGGAHGQSDQQTG